MSTIGKVFIILNALLAAAFLGYAIHALGKTEELLASHKKSIAELTVSKDALEKEKSELQVKLDGETKAKDAARNESETNKQEAERNRRELDSANADNAKFQAELARIGTTLNDVDATTKDSISKMEKSFQEASAAAQARDTAVSEKDAAETARRNAEDQLRLAQASIADLEKQLTTAKKTNSALETELGTIVAVTGVDRSKIVAQPAIDGAVLSADPALKLITLNVGKDAGVTAGMSFAIYRGPTYKGEARIQKVQSNMSSALITLEVPGQRIGQGDSASTRL